MAFRSNYESKRTWDPDSGWELRATRHGPEYQNFELKHPTLPSIEFWGDTQSFEKTGETNDNGSPIYNSIFKVHAVNHVSWPIDHQHKRLIREALNAYGSMHNGPLGKVEVIFPEHSQSRYIVVFLDCGTPTQLAEVAQRHTPKGIPTSSGAIAARDFLSDLVARGRTDAAELGPSTWGFLPNYLLERLAVRPGRNSHDHRVASWATKRESLDGSEFMQKLGPFWRDVINLDRRKPADKADDRFGINQMRAAPMVGEAARMMDILNFDHALVAFEDRKNRQICAWRITAGIVGARIEKHDGFGQFFSVSVDE
jgi:hypothetical protein